MVDVVRLQRLLRRLTDDLAVLRIESAADSERKSDVLWLRGVKYVFITAIENCVDMAQHICAAEGYGPPSNNGDAIRLLAQHGVITHELGQQVRKAVGFRNVLVHDYAEVDDAVVQERLSDLTDLRAFSVAIGRFLGGIQKPADGR